MRKETRAAHPFFGEEIEWAFDILQPDNSYRLPDFDELAKMINGFRQRIGFFAISPEKIFENPPEELKKHLGKFWQRLFPGDLKELSPPQCPSSLSLGFGGLLPSSFRLYIDGYHLETSTPGCTNTRDLMISSRVSELMLNICARILESELPPGNLVKVYKETSDRKKASFAGHENYLINQETFRRLTNEITDKTLQLASFLALRIPLTGAGKTGSENLAPPADFQISQRADWIKCILGRQTTERRPLVNARNEPLARYTMVNGKKILVSRLHVICGEPNMSLENMMMRFGYTSRFLLGLQDDIFDDVRNKIILRDPVKAMKIISRDLSCGQTVELINGKCAKFYEILRIINDRLRWYFQEIRPATPEDLEILEKVEYYCDCFAKGHRHFQVELVPELDWLNRFNLCDEVRKPGEKWSSLSEESKDMMYYTDLHYGDIDRRESYYYKFMDFCRDEGLIKDNALSITDEEINYRLANPPTDSREYLRGKILKKFPHLYCDWDFIRFSDGRSIYLDDPHRGGKNEVGDLVENCKSEDDLIGRLKELNF